MQMPFSVKKFGYYKAHMHCYSLISRLTEEGIQAKMF